MLSSSASQPCTVLVVDEDEVVLASVHRALAARGFDVHVTSDGRKALAMLERIRRPCAVLLDLEMSGTKKSESGRLAMSGVEVLQALESSTRFESLPVVLLAAPRDGGWPTRGGRARPVVTKPIETAQLVELVRRLCEEERNFEFALEEPPSALIPRKGLR